MLILRPSRIADLPEVVRIAEASAIGITSLPPDRDKLYDKIRQSVESFEPDRDVSGEETYFFVLEDAATGRLMGTSGITAEAGFHDRFYSYRNETIVHASQELAVSNRIHALHLCHDLTGYALLTSFWIDPSLYDTEWPQLLSRGRLLFLREYSQRFGDKIAAENPGVCDEQGRSPFWDAVGRRFFNMDYPQAERLSGGRSKTFIAELMPHYPIYVPLLPAEAKLAIGQLHPVAELPFSILLAEGFDADTYIDIFDGGPTVEARISMLRSIAKQRRLQVTVAPDDVAAGRPHLISNVSADGFRATIATLKVERDSPVLLPPAIATTLGVESGDAVRVVPL
ncbi:MAG: arginine N-succinyltransferase [Betaproteobacteria bacterium]|nr:arginine N-succinyltransferase [Betaproteobacteria bacterium]